MKYVIVLLLLSLIVLSIKVNGSKRHLVGASDTTDTLNKPLILIQFIVEKDGSLSNIKGRMASCNGCTKSEIKQHVSAAIQALKKSSSFTPRIVNGKPERTAYTLPIRLTLNKDSVLVTD